MALHPVSPCSTGKGNPIACILSAAMMLEYPFGEKQAAIAIKKAVEKVLAKNDGYRTYEHKEKVQKSCIN